MNPSFARLNVYPSGLKRKWKEIEREKSVKKCNDFFKILPSYYKDQVSSINGLLRMLCYKFELDYGNVKNWFFYEPWLEINVLFLPDNEDELIRFKTMMRSFKRIMIERVCYYFFLSKKEYNFMIQADVIEKPTKSPDPDWYCNNKNEMCFGALRYHHCSEITKMMLNENFKINSPESLGVEAQISRTIHPLCNNMGLLWIDEMKICLRRGFLIMLFLICGFNRRNRVKWIWEKIFRQKYLGL